MKRLAIIAVLMFGYMGLANAYEMNWVSYTDYTLQPWTGHWNYVGDINKRVYNKLDNDLGTLTITFDYNEIGQDIDGVKLIAGKEAAKHGGNILYYVSSSEYKNTGNIAGFTCRVIFRGTINLTTSVNNDGIKPVCNQDGVCY